MKISKLVTNIRVSDSKDVGAKILELLTGFVPEDKYVVSIGSDMKEVLLQLAVALNESAAESEMDLYDTNRDNTYRSIMYLNRSYLLHPDASIKAAALKVEKVFEKYGFELITENYSSQTALTDAFIRDMTDAGMEENTTLLTGINDLVKQLTEDQSLFKQAEKEWHKVKNYSSSKQSATQLKHELMKIINNKLVVYLRAMNQLSEETYKDLCISIASHINQANALVKRRMASSDSAEGEN
ncbi:MAG: DUF6261 family protein [Bacteroidales bacterium]|nr:DUF6261 family protein [Bacteroidales bacterium]